MPYLMAKSLRQLLERGSRLSRESNIKPQHVFYLLLLVLCFPVTLPIAICVTAVLLSTDALARRLSLSKYKRPQPPLSHLRHRLIAGIYALQWLMQAVVFAPMALGAAFISVLDCIDHRSGMREQGLIANVPVDVYAAPEDGLLHEMSDRPLIVLLHGGNYGPLVCRKWMMAPIARKLQSLGYSVVVPEIDATKSQDLVAMVRDLKLVLSWIGLHAAEIHGDAEEVYVMGHGFGAYLALLLSVQLAAVQSRDDFQMQHPEYEPRSQYHDDNLVLQHPEVVLPNGLTEARIYAPDIDIVAIKGLILLAPISDTQKHLEWEASQGTFHLSPMRQILGRSCLFHSPAHLLFAARSVLTVEYLPSKILIIHGGRDKVVRSSQSDMLQELLVGAGMHSAQKSLRPELDHTDLLIGLSDDGWAKQCTVLQDVTKFIASSA